MDGLPSVMIGFCRWGVWGELRPMLLILLFVFLNVPRGTLTRPPAFAFLNVPRGTIREPALKWSSVKGKTGSRTRNGSRFAAEYRTGEDFQRSDP